MQALFVLEKWGKDVAQILTCVSPSGALTLSMSPSDAPFCLKKRKGSSATTASGINFTYLRKLGKISYDVLRCGFHVLTTLTGRMMNTNIALDRGTAYGNALRSFTIAPHRTASLHHSDIRGMSDLWRQS